MTTKDDVKTKIINQMIKGYMASDLKRMLNVEVIENNNGNLNFPITLYTFSCIEFLGYLATGKENTAAIHNYLKLFFESIDREKISEAGDKFVDVFRNGLSHEFFPKMAGISRKKEKIMWLDYNENKWVLDADMLANMFIKSIDNLEKWIEDNDKYTDIAIRYNDKQKQNATFKHLNQNTSFTISSSDTNNPNQTTTFPPLTSENKKIESGATYPAGPIKMDDRI